MQEIYNAGWYSSNEVCSWPFTNTLYSVDGVKLSDSIISDLRVVTSNEISPYLSGVQITDDFVSVVLSSDTGIIASVTLKQPVTIHKNYVLTAFIPGLTGTIAFGHGVMLERGSWHFAPSENILDGACIRLFSFPVTSISVEKKSKITGRVILNPGTDLEITPCTVSLGNTRAEGYETADPGLLGTGYMISLSSDAENRATSASNQAEILTAYAGSCQMRPENNDCPYITEINGVSPDENGNITIRAEGGLSLDQVLIPVAGYDSVEECAEDGLYSNTILLSSDEVYAPYPAATPVRRCGKDLCAPEDSDSDSDDPDSGSDGEDDEAQPTADTPPEDWSMRSVYRNARLIPRDDNYGAVYVNDTDSLNPVGNGTAFIYFSDTERTQVFAAFELLEDHDLGIIFNLDLSNAQGYLPIFRLLRTTLSLSHYSNALIHNGVKPHAKVSMHLIYENGFFIGNLKVYSGYEVYTKKLSHRMEKSGLFGLYMKNCKCLMWSEV